MRSSGSNFSTCSPSVKPAVSTDRHCHCDLQAKNPEQALYEKTAALEGPSQAAAAPAY